MINWRTLTTPNERGSREIVYTVIALWLIVWTLAWFVFRPAIFPSPLDVLRAYPALWLEQGLGQELLSSLRINVEGLILSTVIALPLAYLSRVLLFAPVVLFAAKLRFLSPVVFFVPLLLMTSTGHQLKVAMLVLGEAWFLLTTMLGVVANIPSYRLDDARTLRMNEWTTTWYVTVRGTFDQALDAIRDNAAMGWSALMMIEGIVRSEGGVGVMLIDAGKYRDFSAVYAIAGLVLLVGIAQDAGLGTIKRAWCPYAEMATR